MTSISPISFCGSGSESAGSIAYRNKPSETATDTETKVNFRGNGSETTGSIANNTNPSSIPTPPTITTDTVQFRGSGAETTGSIAHTNEPSECPSCGAPVNFKGSYKEDKKSVSAVGIIGGLVAITAATIIGLGYAHKKGAFKNLSDGWIKKAGEKVEPVAAKCHEWCGVVKKTGLEWWGKLKGSASKSD